MNKSNAKYYVNILDDKVPTYLKIIKAYQIEDRSWVCFTNVYHWIIEDKHFKETYIEVDNYRGPEIKGVDGIDNIYKTHETHEICETHETGAVRSKDANNVRYDLITPVGLRRIAETYAEGAKKYGVDNWKKGFKISSLINHAIRHIELYKDGVDKSEDHLAHAVWNIMTAMHFEERMPSMQDMQDMCMQDMQDMQNEK